MQLAEFLSNLSVQDVWVNYRHGSIHMRHSARTFYGHPITLDIVNVTFQPRGTGGFTALLDELEPHYGIYIENVLSNRLHRFLKSRGYADTNMQYPWCMARPVTRRYPEWW